MAGSGGFNPDSPAMPFDDTVADCEPDPASGQLLAMKPLERLENLIHELRLNPESVVPTREEPLCFLVGYGDMNQRRGGASVVDRVSDKILKNLHEACRLSWNLWQHIVGDSRAGGFRRAVQILHSRLQ